MTKIAGSRSESGSRSISQRHGSADPDPDPHQNVMDPEHCLNLKVNKTRPVSSETSQSDGENERSLPAVALRPTALQSFAKHYKKGFSICVKQRRLS
jgi:hypothetical protein